jgi:O-acetyl-ADP-ribose deacetylase (regulator of RNase III)
MIELAEGNLLQADVEALVNTVNTVGVMGKGIALQFKKAFPEMFPAYKAACAAGDIVPGRVHVYERDDLLNPKYVINFPTKTHWKGKSQLDYVERGLQDLVRVIRQRGIRSIALPPLGCGLGGLNWPEVLERIQTALGDLEGVLVLVYPPNGAPRAEAIIDRTQRPKLTTIRANVLRILADYFVLGYELSLLEVQKLLYFYQEAGESLRLRFVADRYGPYADNLRHVMNTFEGHFTTGFGDGRNSPDTQIRLIPGALDEAKEFLAHDSGRDSASDERAERVMELIRGFESPYGMELLATVHWVAKHSSGEPANSAEEAVTAVHEWNERKRQMMRPQHIHIAWDRLAEKGWL